MYGPWSQTPLAFWAAAALIAKFCFSRSIRWKVKKLIEPIKWEQCQLWYSEVTSELGWSASKQRQVTNQVACLQWVHDVYGWLAIRTSIQWAQSLVRESSDRWKKVCRIRSKLFRKSKCLTSKWRAEHGCKWGQSNAALKYGKPWYCFRSGINYRLIAHAMHGTSFQW